LCSNLIDRKELYDDRVFHDTILQDNAMIKRILNLFRKPSPTQKVQPSLVEGLGKTEAPESLEEAVRLAKARGIIDDINRSRSAAEQFVVDCLGYQSADRLEELANHVCMMRSAIG
jgi:hypothetical protein